MFSFKTRTENEKIRKICQTAKEAYIWGWPSFYVHNLKTKLDLVKKVGKSGGSPVAPINELAVLANQIDARNDIILCPSLDFLYGFGIFDLDESPVVIQVPDFGDRFWLYQLGDQRTNSFAKIGSIHKTKPGFYLVVGPNQKQNLPKEIKNIIYCPTRFAYCIPRIFFEPFSQGDFEKAVNSTFGIMAYPLIDFNNKFQYKNWRKLKWLPNLSNTKKIQTKDFLKTLPEIIKNVPALPNEKLLYEKLNFLIKETSQSKELFEAANKTIFDIEKELEKNLFNFGNFGVPLPNGWHTIDNGAEFGADYLTRIAVAKSNPFVNHREEVKYYYLCVDNFGQRLNGKNKYIIKFLKDNLPPSNAFWSLTIYDSNYLLPKNLTKMRWISSKNQSLKFESDGSIFVYIKPEGCVEDENKNTILCPKNEFYLYLRVYDPKESATKKTWTPPKVSVF